MRIERAARPSHVTIFASAGSGKTHALAARYIRLLAHQLPENPADDAAALRPGSLLALTFTRKAAAEFFDTILEKIAVGAASSDGAGKLAAAIGDSWLERSHCVRLLRAMIGAMPTLGLGTLDSFFARLLRAFPFEFGLGGGFTLSDEAMAAGQRLRVYRRLFRPEPEVAMAENSFLRAFRFATYGREERGIADRLERFIGGCHGLCLEVWEGAKWGSAVGGWSPFGKIALDPNARHTLRNACARLEEAIEREKCLDAQRAAWREIAELISSREPGTPLDGKLGRFLTEKVEPNWRRLGQGGVEFAMGRTKGVWSPVLCQALEAALTALIGFELQAQAVQTQGLWQIARQFEAHYDALVRQHGHLTFADLAYLLSGATATGRAAGAEVWRLKREAIERRLDVRYDHWLIDEFQDTSLLQWRIMEPLVSELLQFDDGTRSYFHVGDMKQAIYGWRGGEARLARLLLEETNRGRQRIKDRTLTKSRRSCAPVIALINAVFGASDVMRSLFPAEAVNRWEWQDHSSANADSGCAAVIRPQRVEQDMTDAEWQAVAAILQEIDPIARGLSCAVLVPRNEDVLEVGNFLRREGLPVVADAESPVATDNSFTVALLSLLEFAAHPGDRFAREHVRFTPLQKIITNNGWKDGDLVWEVLRAIEAGGFEAVLRAWINAIGLVVPIGRFSARRGDELLQIAREFDLTGSRDIDAFLETARSTKRRESPDLAAAVQVMTVHQSKGLGFDAVVLPCLTGRRRTRSELGIARKRPAVRTWRDLYDTEWLLRSPAQAISDLVPPLRACREEAEAAEYYELFCRFYVAMTRARRGLYLISPKPSSEAKSGRNLHGWLELALQGLEEKSGRSLEIAGQSFDVPASFGQWEWFKGVAPKRAVAAAEAPRPAMVPPPKARLLQGSPSSESVAHLRAAQIFAPAAAGSRAFGTLVHALFQQVLDPDDLTALEQWQRQHLPAPESWQQLAIRQVRACLQNPAIRAAMGRPMAQASIWREQPFEVVIDQKWITGTFDRVVVEAERVRIIDFKTDVADEGAEGKVAVHRPQLELYRRVAARLTGRSEETISAALIFTRTQQVVAVNFEPAIPQPR